MSCETPKPRPQDLGGEDEPEEPEPDERSCQKYDHALRSLANQPNHCEFWGETITLPEVVVDNPQ